MQLMQDINRCSWDFLKEHESILRHFEIIITMLSGYLNTTSFSYLIGMLKSAY